MSEGLKKWVENPQPLKDESLSSWMIRTALANLNSFSSLLDYIQDYYTDLNIDDINKDYDLNWYYILLDIFSSKTQVPIKLLKEMSLSYLNFKVDEITKVKEDISWRNSIFQELWFTRWKSTYGTGLRFCPLCLKEDKIPFFRNRWRLRYITFCPNHFCLLENKCPNCKSPIAPYRLKWDYNLNQCYKCGFDLSLTKPIILNRNDKLFRISKNFLINPKIRLNKIYDVLLESWLLKYYNLNDRIFQDHPFTKDEELIKIWKGISNKYNIDNKRHLFSNIKATFLLIGIAVKTIKKRESKKKLDKYNIFKIKLVNTKAKRLIMWADLIEGESLSSWLVRSTLQSYMDYFSLISSFPNYFNSSDFYDIGNVDFLGSLRLFKYLSKVTGFNLKTIKQMSLFDINEWMDKRLENFYNKLDINEFRILWKTKGIYNYEVGLRYCPLCLKTDILPYFRKKWRLRYISFCFEHNCYLEERCPKCNGLIESYTLEWGAFNIKHCSKCTADLSQAKPRFIDSEDPLLAITKEFFNEDLNFEEIYKILYRAWSKISLLYLSDKEFNNHPLTFDEELINLWNNSIPPDDIPNRNLLFANIKATFLLIGTTILDLEKSE